MVETDGNASPFIDATCSRLNNWGAELLLVGNRRGAAELFEGAMALSTAGGSSLPVHLSNTWAVSSQQLMEASRRNVAAISSTFPYLILSPIFIREDQQGGIPFHDKNLVHKATILFNMGLTHQLGEPHCSEVPRLYHLATSAFRDVPDSHETFTLAVALLNNAGVWCHANGEPEKARSCMERISQLIADEDEFSLDPCLSKQDILANVRVMVDNEGTLAPPAA